MHFKIGGCFSPQIYLMAWGKLIGYGNGTVNA